MVCLVMKSEPDMYISSVMDTSALVQQIKSLMTSHPLPTIEEDVEKCIVMDDDQWHSYKKHLARIAKENKAKKAKTVSITRNKVRTQRDTSFEAIEISGTIVRICDTTFCITKFSSVKDISNDPVERSHICAAARDGVDYGGYFWVVI
jgi:hypothetical protein